MQDEQHVFTFARNLPVTRSAIEFATERHSHERRGGDGALFITHPLEAAALLERSDFPDEVVAAAVLHDVLENTETEPGDLEQRFGVEVAELVQQVSDDPGIEGDEEQKRELRERMREAPDTARAIFTADKVSKVRELRGLIIRGVPPGEIETKLERYRQALSVLEDRDPSDRLVRLLRFEIETLDELPPHPELLG